MARFQKGKPRAMTAGRKTGTPNKATADIKEFARTVLTSAEYRKAVTDRIVRGKAPVIEKLLYHYAFGRPVERVEMSRSADQASQAQVIVYIPDNGRDSYIPGMKKATEQLEETVLFLHRDIVFVGSISGM